MPKIVPTKIWTIAEGCLPLGVMIVPFALSLPIRDTTTDCKTQKAHLPEDFTSWHTVIFCCNSLRCDLPPVLAQRRPNNISGLVLQMADVILLRENSQINDGVHTIEG